MQLRNEIERQRASDREKEELRLNREIAYKRTMEKEIEEMKERISFVNKECYALKNDVTPELKTASRDVRKLQEELKNLIEGTFSLKRKVEVLDPIIQVQKDGEDLRKCLIDLILSEWRVRISDEYMTAESLKAIHEEQDEQFKKLISQLSEQHTKIRFIETNYAPKVEVMDMLKPYAEKDSLEEIQD